MQSYFYVFISLTVLQSLSLHIHPVKGDLEQVLKRCCDLGRTWAANHTSCTGPPFTIPEIHPDDNWLCQSAIQICCTSTRRSTSCRRGVAAAKSGMQCVKGPSSGPLFENCCKACELGLYAALKNAKCRSPPLTHPADIFYWQCCQDAKEAAAGTQPPDRIKCGESTNGCNSKTEECVNQGGTFKCVPKSPTSSDNCAFGFRWNVNTTKCEDIDECSEDENKCQMDTEECINLAGSFKCFQVPPIPSNCTDGYKWNADTLQCEDIDECSEDENKCQMDTEECINLAGSFKCLPVSPTSTSCTDGYKWNADTSQCEDINECEVQNPCMKNEVCLNTRGSFKCNSITCPDGYVQDRKNRCRKENINCYTTDTECVRKPQLYTFVHISLASNKTIPEEGRLDLYSLSGPPKASDMQFQLTLKNVSAQNNVKEATRADFDVKKITPRKVMVSLIKPLLGPQEVELELSSYVYIRNKLDGAVSAKIFIFVSA